MIVSNCSSVITTLPSAASDASAGKLAGLDKVQSNPKKLTFGSTDTSTGKNITANGDVLYLNFTVPKNAVNGTIYNIDFADLSVYSIDMTKLIPKTEAGWIKVVTDEQPTTEQVTVPNVKSDAQWIIGTTEVNAGATVKLPVSVKGDKDGLNSSRRNSPYPTRMPEVNPHRYWKQYTALHRLKPVKLKALRHLQQRRNP